MFSGEMVRRGILVLVSIIVHGIVSTGGGFSLIFGWLAQGDPVGGWARHLTDLGRGLSLPSTRYYAVCLIIAVASLPVIVGVTDAWLIGAKRRRASLTIFAAGIVVALTNLLFYLTAAYLPPPGIPPVNAYGDIVVRLVAPLMLSAWLLITPLLALCAHAILSIAINRCGLGQCTSRR